MGAILAVLVAYWDRFWNVGKGLLLRDKGAITFTRNIILGFLPAMVIGVVAYDAIRAAIQTPMIVAVMLVAGGIVIHHIVLLQGAAWWHKRRTPKTPNVQISGPKGG